MSNITNQESTTTKLILDITKKLKQYEENRKRIAWLFDDDKEKQEFFLGEANAFNLAADTIAQMAKAVEE